MHDAILDMSGTALALVAGLVGPAVITRSHLLQAREWNMLCLGRGFVADLHLGCPYYPSLSQLGLLPHDRGADIADTYAHGFAF